MSVEYWPYGQGDGISRNAAESGREFDETELETPGHREGDAVSVELRRYAFEIALGASSVRPFIEKIHAIRWDMKSEYTNVGQALAHIRDPEAEHALIEALDDKDVRIRTPASQALGAIGTEKAVVPLLRNFFVAEPGSFEIDAIAGALARIGDISVVEPIIEYLNTPKSDVRVRPAAIILGALGDDRAALPLLEKVKTEEYPFEEVTRALENLGYADELKQVYAEMGTQSHADYLKEYQAKKLAENEKNELADKAKKEKMESEARRTGYRCQRCGGGVEPRNQKCPYCGADLIFFP